MNKKISSLVAFGLLACSMVAQAAPPAAPAATTASKAPLTALVNQYDQLKPKLAEGAPYPRACYLGKDCLALDSKPFEICHLAGKDCDGQKPELLLVKQAAAMQKTVDIAPVKKP
jgi:hypothetical protein